jgi:serine phosphatase RsbU (regulator of sigma subunit)
MIVPISARGVILGTVAIFRMRQPAFTTQDVSLAQDVLVRSAICLDNARVYSRERATALELQRSMLPQTIVEIPGIELAYRYEPANMAAEIGGDWFDVVLQTDGRVALIVGDVTGHDIHAASLMGQLRTVTRTLATLDLSPVEVLTRLDAMVSDMGGEAGATCVYAAFDPETRRCVIVRAGHPPPALVLPAGGVDFLDLPTGLPLGVGGATFESVELSLQPGTVLVLYTDGLIESRATGIDMGMENLARELAAGAVVPFDPQCASTLINRLVADPADDIAVLVARVSEDLG